MPLHCTEPYGNSLHSGLILFLVFNCNSDIGAYVWSDICNLICLRHLFRSKFIVFAHLKFIFKNNLFSFILRNVPTVLQSNISTMGQISFLRYFFRGGGL